MKWAMGPSGRLLAGISSQTVYLWQLQPFVLLSKLEYDEVDGSMIDVVWHPREHLLWVVLTSGQVYEVSVVGGSEQQQALEYRFRTEHYWAQGVGEEGGIRGRSMVHERTLLVEEHGSPLCALALPLDDGVQVATRSRIVRIAWDGLIRHTMVVGEVAEDPLAQLVCMVGVEQQQCAYLFSDGSLWVHSTDTGARSQLAAGHAATSVAYSAMNGVLAVGTRAGDMLLFAEQAGLLRETRHLRGMQSSAITALAWSHDGHAIACANRSGHVTVRSALGYELSTSRVRSPAWFLCWGRLRVFAMGHTADALPLARASLGCAGAAAAAAAVASEATRVCLVSDDKLLLHDCGFGVEAPGDVVALQWRVVQMPGAYMAMWGWPPEHTAVSGDGLHVAVAGRRGLAVVSIKTGAWRLLRTRQQEASLRVSGLLWLGNHVVAACTVDGLPQLLFFARGSRGALDLDTAHAEALGGVAPLCVSCHDALLLVLCADLRVRQYDVFAQGDSLRVSFSRSVDVRGANVCWRRVRSLQWVPGARFDRRPMFLVHEGARLCVLDGLTQEVRVLAERAEHVIISG
ncbi:WD40 repeat protein, partial [Kickxella alabastrina]